MVINGCCICTALETLEERWWRMNKNKSQGAKLISGTSSSPSRSEGDKQLPNYCSTAVYTLGRLMLIETPLLTTGLPGLLQAPHILRAGRACSCGLVQELCVLGVGLVLATCM